MKKIPEIFVVLEDRPGVVGEMCRVLKKKNVAIYAIGLFGDTARLYVSDADKARRGLAERNYTVDVREVLATVLPNHVGALMEFTQKLGNAGINIKYMYGTLVEKQKKGLLILEVDEPELALNLFKNDAPA